MIEMPQDPVRGPDPADPHEQCERVIEQLEHEAARVLTFAELHGLVGSLVGDHAYAVSVQRWHHPGGICQMTWRVSWFPEERDCRIVEATTAAGAYAKLRAQLAPASNPLDEVGDIPW